MENDLSLELKEEEAVDKEEVELMVLELVMRVNEEMEEEEEEVGEGRHIGEILMEYCEICRELVGLRDDKLVMNWFWSGLHLLMQQPIIEEGMKIEED